MINKKVLVSLLIVVFAALPALGIEPVSKCDALAVWAAGLETLPADYTSFTALEPAQRSAVYRRLTNPQRAALWQEQLSQELAKDGWNETQRSLIAESRAFMTVENLAAAQAGIGGAFEATRAAAASLEARAKEAFPREVAMRVFYGLGPEKSSPTSAGLAGYCNCAADYIELCGPIGVDDCVYGQCHDPRYCGWQWMYLCDSNCGPA